MQDIEFTIEHGKLWMLQTRNGKRTAKRAAHRRRHGRRGHDHHATRRSCASSRPSSTSCCTRRSIPSDKRKPIAKGLPASPGAASGKIVFTADEAEALQAAGEKCMLVRVETSPEDIHGMTPRTAFSPRAAA